MVRPNDPVICGVYSIRCTITGHQYIGSSKHIWRRFADHRGALRAGKGHNKVLQFAWDVFGEAYFIFTILEECPEVALSEVERKYLQGELLFNILKDVENKFAFGEK
ncbi:hypothetical protein LCGC14_0599640 [marine sediment metagenome]|uniref:GIY-YIG domain-containing protein n=1 Tax=marine sediment metagenome TaxID=412755 RepID=A0A0F9RFQ9_9ZZZZ